MKASSANLQGPSATQFGMPSMNTTFPVINATTSDTIPTTSSRSRDNPNKQSNAQVGGNTDKTNNASGNKEDLCI